MASATTVQRDWIASEFSKGIEAEHGLIEEAKGRAKCDTLPTMQVLYNEIASADERHRSILETIATRYGHVPTRSSGGGITDTIGRLKDKVSEMGSTPLQKVSHDLGTKANAIHWYKAWIVAFQTLEDAESARELTAILTEEQSHLDALQEGLNQLVVQGATTGDVTSD